MAVVWRGVESIRFLQSFSAPFMMVMSLLLLALCCIRRAALGRCWLRRASSIDAASFLQFFFPALTGMVGYWATLSLNIPDFTRYAKSQESQIVGQAFGLPVAMTLFSLLGIACTSASTVIFGRADLVAGGAAWAFPSAAACVSGADRAAGCYAECEYRGERGGAFQ